MASVEQTAPPLARELTSEQADAATLFVGDGEMARRGRALDWEATALGGTTSWPAALRTAVRMTIESPFPINLWCGPELELIYNDAFRAVLDARHPALGRPGPEVWAEIWPDIAPMFDRIRTDGTAAYAEDARFLTSRSGESPRDAWFTFSLSAVRDEGGDVIAFFSVVSETTQRIRAEVIAKEARAAAEHAEQRVREIFAQAPAFMAVVRGPTFVFEFANDAYLRLVGGRDILGKPVAEALPEVRKQGFIELLESVVATGEPFVGRELPVMLARTPGAELEQVYVDFVYQPLTDATGACVGIVVHGSDVTAAVLTRRETERLWQESESARAQLAESERRYRFLANAIPVQVWAATAEGALDYVSDRTAEYFGKTAVEVVGEQWLGVLHPDDVKPTLDRWRASLESGDPYEVEFRLWSTAHGDYRWHLGRATTQRDDAGRVIRWIGTNTEIEDRKQVEAELTRLTTEATEANRAKSDFLAAMSHELRTPLNAIGGYAQLIEMGVRGPVTEEQRIDLLKIQRSKNHLDSLVSDVLNFAKLASGRVEYRIRELSVQRTVEAVLEMVMPQLLEKGLHLAPITHADAVCIVADEDKTRQILINLLTNALKFTPADGSIALAVDPRAYEVAISVRDTGVGIPADLHDRIFEPFVQAKRALKSSDQGVGLGLSISRQFARAMRGELTVASTVGAGSTFTLTLPRA